ncbi:MAG: NAD(P)/FAD-dependent oxidoreductase [Acidobacteriota bacterium]|nr:MAG: NAD(P)/FAD-dependent oxidoreductase [Acidobacteriota bacterium]
MAKTYDTVVIGGGHNGLIAAAYLAKAGKSVLVLERRHILGGATVTEEVYPGFKYTTLSYVVSMLRPEIIRDLELAKYGLQIIPLASTFTPLPDGNYFCIWDEEEKTLAEVRRFSGNDADAFAEFDRLMTQLARFVKNFLNMVPPDPRSFRPRELRKFLDLGKRFQALGDNSFTFAKLMTMSAMEFLDMFFETDVIKAQMATAGIIGTCLGIRSPGTAYVLLHHYMGQVDGATTAWGIPRGGTGAVPESIAASARNLGAEIRVEAPVAKILVKGGKAAGVVLESGEEIRAKTVATSVDPHVTFIKLLDSKHVPDDFLEYIRRYKYRGSSGKVNMALDGFPTFTGLPKDMHLRAADISISPSSEFLERAYDDAKYGEFSKEPFCEVCIPTTVDPTMAPPGKHVMSVFVQYAPYELKKGLKWDEKYREAFGDAVVNAIAKYSPDLKNLILHRQTVSPYDMEQEYGLTGGNIFQGELTLEQLFMMRPAPGYAQYRMPLKNLYMCGSGAHPGGGIMGAPARLCVKEMLKDF